MPRQDVIIIGSGLAGTHASVPLVERGCSVTMLDVGIDGSEPLDKVDERSYEEIRRSDPEQYKIFLGSDFSAIGADENATGHAVTMTSGRRSYVTSESDRFGPVEAEGAGIVQSFARGGLSESWSGVCDIFDESELNAVGLPAGSMKEHYQDVISRIGVSGSLAEYALQEPPRLDDNARELMRRYARNRGVVNDLGFELRAPIYAMLTRDLEDRRAQSYREMDFWDMSGRTIYRARYTLERLCNNPNFRYMGGHLVLRIKEGPEGVLVETKDVRTGARVRLEAANVILAAGAINTTRILMMSYGLYDQPAPVILKNNYIVPCLFPARLGKWSGTRRHGLAQLVMHGTGKDHGMGDLYAQLLSYNSLQLFRLLRYAPMAVPHALRIFSVLAPALVLADIRFSSITHKDHSLVLRQNGGDGFLQVVCHENDTEVAAQRKKIGVVKRALWKLGLIPLTSVRNPYGAASHYAGGAQGEALSVCPNGLLRGCKRTFVADAAGWKALPAKPPGLTIMANANRIGSEVARLLA